MNTTARRQLLLVFYSDYDENNQSSEFRLFSNCRVLALIPWARHWTSSFSSVVQPSPSGWSYETQWNYSNSTMCQRGGSPFSVIPAVFWSIDGGSESSDRPDSTCWKESQGLTPTCLSPRCVLTKTERFGLITQNVADVERRIWGRPDVFSELLIWL